MRQRVATGTFAVALLAAARPAATQQRCPRAWLPAYSHNDYTNPRPLFDALNMGFSGVEADVFLVAGTLRLGHERKHAARGPALETVYLKPLTALLQLCPGNSDRRLFLLTIEQKEESRETFDSLAALLSRYPEITRGDMVNVVLVGWHPPAAELVRAGFRSAKIQARIRDDAAPTSPGTPLVGLASLDYGQTMGRWWRSPAGRRAWLRAIREQKRIAPDIPIRVYDVPERADVYQELFDAGVDLIGAKDLRRTLALFGWPLAEPRPRFD